ncbi:antigen 5 like allergen Cul n 1-like [Anopheles nili]|uniref:antigen 5 like allergen Cul n 1-like n=1 Tax=Anopheles nili TaxID=185578 RepID=UPI00237C0736|nr:antigen 5 like allergen Cul n 1-like [Anopheles nili]
MNVVSITSLLSLGCLLISLGRSWAYKDEQYCNICSNHVACGTEDQLQGNCLKYANVSLTLLNKHAHAIIWHVNHLREKFATGHLHDFNDTYGPMHTVTWDPEMADLCRMNLIKCKFSHDKCRGTLRFPYSGQTLAKLTKCVPANRVEDLEIHLLQHVILHLIDRWYEEYLLTKPSDVQLYSKKSSARKYQIGHFLQLINCNVCSMGCSLLSYREYHKKDICDTYIMCCNYSYINIVGRPICRVNNKKSTCAKHKQFPGLCKNCSF